MEKALTIKAPLQNERRDNSDRMLIKPYANYRLIDVILTSSINHFKPINRLESLKDVYLTLRFSSPAVCSTILLHLAIRFAPM